MKARFLDIESLELKSGGHVKNSKEFCVMEAVAYVAGEPWSDHPQCACPILSSFMRSWNDSLDDATRQKLKPYIPRLVGTNDGNSDRRGWMFLDWLSRECAPALLELAQLNEHAKALRELPEIVDSASLASAQMKLAEASKAAAATRAAAWDAAWAAAAGGAGAAAWAAAGDAARAAARAAAGDAARAAAGAAARAAAGAATRA